MYLIDELTTGPQSDLAKEDKAAFMQDALAGLTGEPKTLPCKYFYDERGSKLFDAICDLEEYYPTRTEIGIMQEHGDEIAAIFHPGDALVELGSGSSIKTRILLDHLPYLAAYVPVDISAQHLSATVADLRKTYSDLCVLPVAADYTKPFAVPVGSARRVTVYFPGSTIGNFHAREAVQFMRQIRALCSEGGGLLIGVDLRKDVAVLEAAYNDSKGVTAQFNVNLLERMKRELNAGCDVDAFAHHAFFNQEQGRIEMHLISRKQQTLTLGGKNIYFAQGETIWTECSYKHTLDGFAALALQSGFKVENVWTDPQRWFSVQMLRAV